MLNYVNSNLCSTIKRDEQRQEMGEPSSTRRNQKQSSYSSNTELLVHKKTQIHLHSFPFNPTPKPLMASCCYSLWGLI
ncbi:hypothetical protein NC653_009651 [Populus alba x Populus x berolinensis]|uniref:Uncharacterized protein n=1 Tax=Populus alba x Populus x berolinensis TaxID=444605 RepID=A0AAD6R9Y3_9ROSI|nr:hypothetical protein NC653_009651 [Populus alba x Populus x berolinensis]